MNASAGNAQMDDERDVLTALAVEGAAMNSRRRTLRFFEEAGLGREIVTIEHQSGTVALYPHRSEEGRRLLAAPVVRRRTGLAIWAEELAVGLGAVIAADSWSAAAAIAAVKRGEPLPCFPEDGTTARLRAPKWLMGGRSAGFPSLLARMDRPRGL